MTVASVGLGANLGDPRRQLQAALEALGRLPGTRMLGASSFYRSAPLGYADQPDFINAVAQLDTTLAAEDLLARLQDIERAQGRERSFPNAPRSLDLDLLLYGEDRIETPRLRVPHPRMHERAFVLKPLLELDPQARVPGRGDAAALLADCGGQDVEKVDG
jgi:2-amino-4-hydroxy-6-hydroxymethyldihydropteridine diphosphokinase